MVKKNLDELTREQWRELGFYYELNEEKKFWLLKGSREGILKFAHLLEEYSNNPRNEKIHEHDHYGPYWYLKIMTWYEPEIADRVIVGKLEDFRRLALLIRDKLSLVTPGDKFTIKEEYSKISEFALVFELQENDFDPAEADPLLPKA